MGEAMNAAEIISTTEKVLAKEGAAIAQLVGRPLAYTQGISFRVNEDKDGVADTSGEVVTFYKKYFDQNPHDLEGVVVHELAHAIERGVAYHGDFVWMVEGLADFVRHKLGYGIILPGDPRESYKVAGAFFNWLYERPDDKRSYYTFVKELNAGTRPRNLDALLEEYNSGSPKKDFSSAARKGKGLRIFRRKPPQPGLT
jgi:hypothetical protein